MATYKQEFKKYEIISSQVLLEATIFKNTQKLSHAKAAIETLLKNDVVPIINENDVTVIDELVFGDNDQLAAYVSHYFDSDLLVILTDIDGYYDDNPHTNKDAKLQSIVKTISTKELEATHSANTQFATGGIVTKLKAAKFLMDKNKNMFLTSGFDLDIAKEYLLNDNQIGGSLFIGKENANKIIKKIYDII
jgi:glutamate 5-kinase